MSDAELLITLWGTWALMVAVLYRVALFFGGSNRRSFGRPSVPTAIALAGLLGPGLVAGLDAVLPMPPVFALLTVCIVGIWHWSFEWELMWLILANAGSWSIFALLLFALDWATRPGDIARRKAMEGASNNSLDGTRGG